MTCVRSPARTVGIRPSKATTIVRDTESTEPTFTLRFAAASLLLVTGYAVSLVGSIAFFKIPLLATFAMMLGGTLVSYYIPKLIDRRFAVATPGRIYKITIVAGSLALVGLMLLFAKSDWRRWYIHPAGFQSIWFYLNAAVFHIDAVRRRISSLQPNPEIELADYDEKQANNPYAPPMRAP